MVHKSQTHTASVSSINGVEGAVILSPGANITITTLGQTITISSTGGGSSDGTNEFLYALMGA